MSNADTEHNTFTRPGFVVAGVVVGAVAVLGVVLGTGALDAEPTPPASAAPTTVQQAPSESESPDPAETDGAGLVPGDGDSICGLGGSEDSGTVTTAPDAEWSHDGTVAYPTSQQHGPGDTTGDGVRYCFGRTPTGALFAAANAVVHGANPQLIRPWMDYFVAEGPGRVALLADNTEGATTGTAGTRLAISGFRVLDYTPDAATVDIAVTGSTQGQTVNLSMVYDLVWEDGDWKLRVDNPEMPVDVATIPNSAGYIAWGE